MKEIPPRSEIAAAQTALRTEACSIEVERIGNRIVEAIVGGATAPGALVYFGKEPYVPPDVASQLQMCFALKGWILQFTRGVCGSCAIFLMP